MNCSITVIPGLQKNKTHFHSQLTPTMGRHAQIVMGPAGSGKSTFCATIQAHMEATKRTCHIVNLDPAAEPINYKPSIDIRDLISLDDVQAELQFGPNGGLVFCMEYLEKNMDWLEDELAEYEDDYLLFDCPGQIELYSHIPVMKSVTNALERVGYKLCGVYMVDCTFLSDASKFLSAGLACLSAMCSIEIAHINVISKLDMLKSRKQRQRLAKYLDMDVLSLQMELDEKMGEDFMELNHGFASLLRDFSMVSFLPLDRSDPESVESVLIQVDNALQYGEDVEPQEPKDEAPEDE